MKIRKVKQNTALVGNVVNEKIDSNKDAYSCDYVNTKFSEVTDFTNKVTFNENYAKAIFLKIGKVVIIMYQGASKNHTSGEVVMKIPTEYLPYFKGYVEYLVPSNINGGTTISMCIKPNGDVLCYSNTNGRIHFQCAYIIN